MRNTQAAKTVLILAVGIPLAFFVWRAKVHREQIIAENITFLHSLRGDSISRVTISDPQGVALKEVTDEASLAVFAEALHSIGMHEPNHPSYTRDFVVSVEIKGAPRQQYKLHTLFHDYQSIYMDFPYGGSGKSEALFGWMRAQGLL